MLLNAAVSVRFGACRWLEPLVELIGGVTEADWEQQQGSGGVSEARQGSPSLRGTYDSQLVTEAVDQVLLIVVSKVCLHS